MSEENTVSTEPQVPVVVDEVKSSFPETTYEQDLEKYTKIDNLDEDKGSEQYILVSFASPESIMNCKVRALKIRHYRGRPAVFESLETADAAAKELNEVDKYFPIFVMSTGRWSAWDPDLNDKTKVHMTKYKNEKEQEIMDGLEVLEQQKLTKELQEQRQKTVTDMNALVGKIKDKVDTEEVDHKHRVAQTIKDGVENKDAANYKPLKDEEPEVVPVKKSKSHTASSVRNKLRKHLEEKKKREDESSNTSNAKQLAEKKDELTTQLKTTTQSSSNLEANINKAKSLLEKLKAKQ
jgi:hypothetical protein